MNWFSRLFAQPKTDGAAPAEHAVILWITYEALPNGMPADVEVVNRMHQLQHRLESATKTAGVGDLDGDEFGGGGCSIYMYGPDADALWAVIAPILEHERFPKGSHATRRYGSARGSNAREDRVNLEWNG